MTLGDQSAYDLAKTIEIIFLNQKNMHDEEIIIKGVSQEKYSEFRQNFDYFLQKKKKEIYFFSHYDNLPQKGLEVKEFGMSKKMIELCFGNDCVLTPKVEIFKSSHKLEMCL